MNGDVGSNGERNNEKERNNEESLVCYKNGQGRKEKEKTITKKGERLDVAEIPQASFSLPICLTAQNYRSLWAY